MFFSSAGGRVLSGLAYPSGALDKYRGGASDLVFFALSEAV
jgi:hypothetical protein